MDRLLRNSVSTEQSDEYRVMKADIDVIHKRYTGFIRKYTRITGNHLSSTTALNISTMCSMIDKLNDLKSKIATFNFFKLAKLSRDTVKLSTRASEALDRLKPEHMTQKKWEHNQEKWNDDNDLPVFNTYVDEVLDCLYDSDKGNKVGIFGPIGVGKTTVLRKLHNRLIEQKP
ncbi:Disease resistance protein family, partial [Perilla frutescens var. frutescens]